MINNFEFPRYSVVLSISSVRDLNISMLYASNQMNICTVLHSSLG